MLTKKKKTHTHTHTHKYIKSYDFLLQSYFEIIA